jgi:hypothetical protein
LGAGIGEELENIGAYIFVYFFLQPHLCAFCAIKPNARSLLSPGLFYSRHQGEEAIFCRRKRISKQ